MDATGYTRGLRRVATLSWLGALALLFAAAAVGALPLAPWTPFAALLLGAIPILLWALTHRPTCAQCGGRLRVVQGFPRIVFGCPRCGARIDTRIHPDF